MSQTPLSSYSGALELVWSETSSVTQLEPFGCTVIQCTVYILRGSDSVPLLSQGETCGLAEPRGGVQEEPGLVEGEFLSAFSGSRGEYQDQDYSQALSK